MWMKAKRSKSTPTTMLIFVRPGGRERVPADGTQADRADNLASGLRATQKLVQWGESTARTRAEHQNKAEAWGGKVLCAGAATEVGELPQIAA